MRTTSKYTLILFLALLFGLLVCPQKTVAQATTDSLALAPEVEPQEAIEIYYVTATPSQEQAYTLYGHAGFRVYMPASGLDLFYDYGNFSFEQEGFLWNFIQGKPLYSIGMLSFESFSHYYRARGSELRLQRLNLSAPEAARMYAYLQQNLLPENKDYLYNFIFDNCANRPLILLTKLVGKIAVKPEVQQLSYRQELALCSQKYPWQTFGTNLSLGYHADRRPEHIEQMFLPHMARRALQTAQWADTQQPVVLSEQLLAPTAEARPRAGSFFNRILTPSWLFGLLFAVYMLALVLAWRAHSSLFLRLLESVLCLAVGLAGVVLWYIGFISAHPFTMPNLNLLLLHPFYLIFLPLIWLPKGRNLSIILHLVNFLVLLLYMVLMLSLGQSFTKPIYWLFMSLLIFSARYALIQYRQKKKAKREARS